MRNISILEHGRLYVTGGNRTDASRDGIRVSIEPKLFRRLAAYDESGARDRDSIFEWHSRYAKAKQWVGVVQVPGLSVEILPKIDGSGVAHRQQSNDAPSPDPASVSTRGQRQEEVLFARTNLLYMLAQAGELPLRERDVASLAVRAAPLSETLVAVFASQLLQQLLRGREHAYATRQENATVLKGSLLFSRHITLNSARRDRFYVEFDEFIVDTRMNRIFKAACRTLLDVTRRPSTQEKLRHSLLCLEEVRDARITDEDFEKTVITRQNERFAQVLNFCRLILSSQSPSASRGGESSFSVLFDMNVVYERFIAAFMQRYVMPAFPTGRLYPQSGKHRQYLFRRKDSRKQVLLLKPDILIRRPDGPDDRVVIIDTKWKRLDPTRPRPKHLASASDLYQLFAYAKRYRSVSSFLLFPHLPGLTADDYIIHQSGADAAPDQEVGIRFVNMNRDIRRERAVLTSELQSLLEPALGTADSLPAVSP